MSSPLRLAWRALGVLTLGALVGYLCGGEIAIFAFGRGIDLSAQPDVGALERILAQGWPGWASAAGGVVLTVASFGLLDGDASARLATLRRVLALLAAATVVVGALQFVSPQARLLVPALLGATLALPLATRLVALDEPSARLDWRVLAALAGIVATIYFVFSYTRHAQFGSGSWDMGCYVQSVWLAAHGKPLVSSVLGGVPVLGDHFIPIVYLLAPLFWGARDGAAWLLAVQALAVASIALPLAWHAQRKGLGRGFTLLLVLCFLFAPATQSFIEFDFHHIAIGMACYAWAFHSLETGRLRRAGAALALLFLCKESTPLYIAFLGLDQALFGGRRRLGLALAVGGATAFAIITGVVMPRLLAGSIEHVQRFEQLGGNFGQALAHGLAAPLRTLAIALTPAVKLETILLTLAGFAFLPLGAPRYFLLALPMLAERFLSTKEQLWGMGFHYGLPLTVVAAFAAIDAAGRLRGPLGRLWERLAGAPCGPLVPAAWLGLACAIATVWIDARGLGAPSELASLGKPYFSRHVELNRRALAMVPPDAAVAAQDHFVPHLALRERIWLLARADRAEYAVASPDEGTWPYRREEVVAMLRGLVDSGWRPIFSERLTIVLQRDARGSVPLAPEMARLLAR